LAERLGGARVLAMISNVLNLLGVVAYWQWIVQGVVLLLAVALYAVDFGHRRSTQLVLCADCNSYWVRLKMTTTVLMVHPHPGTLQSI
jgi:hypothetical protein